MQTRRIADVVSSLHRRAEDLPPLILTPHRSDEIHHVHKSQHTPVLLHYRKVQELVVVHHLQCLKHIHVRRQSIGARRHQAAHSSQLQRDLLGNGPVHHILKGEDSDKLVVLDNQSSLPSISHRYRSVPDVCAGTNYHCLHRLKHGPQSRDASGSSPGLGQQRTQQLGKGRSLSAPNTNQACLQNGIHVAASASTLLLHLLQLANGLVQTLGYIQKSNHVAPVQHRKVPEVVVDHHSQSVQSRVAHLDASRVRRHHILDRAAVVEMLRHDPPHDISVAHDTSETSLFPYNQSRVAPLGLHRLTNTQDAVSDVGGQCRFRPEFPNFT